MVEPVQKMPASMSVRLKNVEKDLANLQNALVQFSQGVNAAFQKQVAPLATRLDDLEEIISVMIDDFGVEALEEKLNARRAAKDAQRVVEAKANIAQGIAKGYLIPATEITADSLVVGNETTADGTVVQEFASFIFRQLKPDAQEALLGKPVGATHQTGPNVFTVTEIYTVDVEAATKVANEPLTKAQTEEAA